MINQPIFRNIRSSNILNNSLNTSLAVCVLFFIVLWGILHLTWYSSLLVSLFCFLSLKWTIEGINLKSQLTEDIEKIQEAINQKLSTELNLFCPEKEKHNLINKILFIENLYSKNNKAQKWEKDKRSYQSLPNILISIGLSGTFLGITINLVSMSTKISGKFNLENVLPEIIGSMAIAFVSSLIALSLSLVLIRLYPSYELDIAKDQLFISLEFELERTIIEKQKYLDFNERITELVEAIKTYSQSLSQFINTIPQINQQFQNTVTLAANNFENLAEQSSQIIRNDTQIFTNTTAILDKAASDLTQLITSLAGLTNIYPEILNSIQETKKSLDNTTNSLNDSRHENGQLVTALSSIASRIQNLIDNNQQNTSQIADQLQKNINTLSGTTQSFSQNTSQITNQLQKDIQTLAGTTQSFSSNTSQITGTLNRYTTEVQTQNNKLQNVSDQIAIYVQEINQIQSDFTSLLQLLRSYQNP